MDRLTSLIVFGRVVECGGFSAAARRLNMSTTMVSNHVQALEDRLNVRLLNRTTRKVSLTEIGQAYYQRSSQILADLDEADRIARALQATPQGKLRLHSSMSVVRFLAPVISEFVDLYPTVSVDLTVSERMVDMVEEGFDLAMRSLPLPDSSLIVRRLTSWRNIVCGSPAYFERNGTPLHPGDLVRHNCMRHASYPFGDEWRFEGPDGETASVRISGNLITNSQETLTRLAIDGRGLFIPPPFIVADDLGSGRLVRVLENYSGVEFAINAFYPHRHHVSAKVRSFIDLLAERFADHRRWMEMNY
ncbi:MAG: LysR family transcriptional regulator [Mesorhizobium sp.]|uniref:LysR family transcriptional regulator n=1 Tax=unclassified Mesorhizobium TaxID=325217 RepID=UPI000F74F40B|nr:MULTISPECIES: LysR family transcriptional regulator [unclassified Mesorhizobium]RVC69414.1 LysR family transcriptional regulator [Mesorhizobium sp. M00.F.Ca.ET.038.03.1.1]RVC80399.1 LysR family transcriptional regulator [Mesorhizobium sp. M2A.F.Ca.ET.046.02.1.1]AZO33978.1 LysR family transcriptional regulator [Mesorhizobium sp. M2A.F.Ca.ET.046.03.2.1]RWB47067.1 MAG: LysR family transcriptional regulator [Mesorhizobium sp.]RWE18244.1 MAG: LysR family transcriptional regulator [Mesorhizobium 